MAFTPAAEFFSEENIKAREEFFARAKAKDEVPQQSLGDALEALESLPTVGGIVYLAGPPIRCHRRG